MFAYFILLIRRLLYEQRIGRNDCKSSPARHFTLEKYRSAGVREYWMLDYEVNRISVYCFSGDRELDTLTLYTFDDRIPVRIFDDL